MECAGYVYHRRSLVCVLSEIKPWASTSSSSAGFLHLTAGLGGYTAFLCLVDETRSRVRS